MLQSDRHHAMQRTTLHLDEAGAAALSLFPVKTTKKKTTKTKSV